MSLLNVFNSIVSTRGATYNVHTSELNPDSGYMVAIKGFGKVVDFDGNLNTFQAEIRAFWIKEVWDQIYNRLDIYMGFWVNDGKLYIDLVEKIENRETAIFEGRRNKQKAIWDANNGKEIFLSASVSNDPDIETDKKY